MRQDTCFDSRDSIDRERNAVDLYDQRDSKEQMSFISFKEGFSKDHVKLAMNVLNQLPVNFSANFVARLEVWNFGDRIFTPILGQLHALTAIQHFCAIQSSFEMCLHLTNVLW